MKEFFDYLKGDLSVGRKLNAGTLALTLAAVFASRGMADSITITGSGQAGDFSPVSFSFALNAPGLALSLPGVGWGWNANAPYATSGVSAMLNVNAGGVARTYVAAPYLVNQYGSSGQLNFGAASEQFVFDLPQDFKYGQTITSIADSVNRANYQADGAAMYYGTVPWGYAFISNVTASASQSLRVTPMVAAQLARDVYNGVNGTGTDGFYLISSQKKDSDGFLANAYSNSDGSQIVVSIRGTFLSQSSTINAKNISADFSFVGDSPTAALRNEVTDSVAFVKQIQQQHPNATLVLAGHSSGGAVAQLLGKASGMSAYAYNAPGSQQVSGSLSNELQIGSWGTVSSSNPNVNYRIFGDQVSLAGTPMGQTVTLQQPSSITYAKAAGDWLEGYLLNSPQFLNAHSMDSVVSQLNTYGSVAGQAEPNYTTEMASDFKKPNLLANSSDGKVVADFLFNLTGSNRSVAIDPVSGTDFLFALDAGSPRISSMILPAIDGVSSYSVRYELNGVWSDYASVHPVVKLTFANSVDALQFSGYDATGNLVTLPDTFFGATFDSGGTVSGALTVSAVPEPTSLSLFVLASAGLLGRRRR